MTAVSFSVLDSFVLWIGGALFLGGALLTPWRRMRRRSAIASMLGAMMMVIAIVLPVRERRATSRMTKIDQWMPVWQFDEQHQIHVDAPPDRVYRAIHEVRASEIKLLLLLVSLRRGFRKGPESILNPSPERPILDVATATTFRWLADDAPHEMVVGTKIGANCTATMNFLVMPDGRGGSNVSTETRVFASDAKALRAFKIYWRIIHPGSAIIRQMWLRAIKRRAESH